MNTPSLESAKPGRVFQGSEGRTYTVAEFPKSNYMVDNKRYDSEGYWAFCVFEGDEFLSARFGFQMGGFNITSTESEQDRKLLQLHLELVSDKGALLWVPTGEFSVDDLEIEPDQLSIRLNSKGRQIFTIQGWPNSRWHFVSLDGDLELDLQFTVSQVTLLPDCILPYSIFAMWETVADLSGTVRYRDRQAAVKGRVFHDHPRILSTRSQVEPRNSYLYTCLSFEDGSAWYSYHARDDRGEFIPYYCFGDYVSPDGAHDFSSETRLLDIEFDENHLPASWRIAWTGTRQSIVVDVSARPFSILRSWGRAAPKDENDFWIYPFVLDSKAEVETGGHKRMLRGRGIPEYVNLEYLIKRD